MKITGTKKIIVEDFPAADREVVQRLALILNPFLDQTNQALNRNLTLTDNSKAKTFRQSLAAGVSTLKLSWDLNERPSDVHIGQLTRKDNSIPTAAYSLHWTYADKVISCTFLGLSSDAHNVTIVAQV